MQIELKQVEYQYGPGAKALDGVDLTVNEGEFLTVIGHSGSGKSTLALILAGLYQPTSGEMNLNGLGRAKDGVLTGVGMVFQYPEHQLFAESVFEEVAFGAKNQGVHESRLPEKVRIALDQVGLDADRYWHQSPFLLSGGQQRRVCLASVLAMDPRVLILDEPSAGLDESGRRWLMELVRDFNAKGRTVIWITHDMTEAAELGDRIVVMNKGRVLLTGTAEEVFAEESRLNAVGLAIPPAAAVVRRLKAKGVPIPGTAVTPEAAAAEIALWLDAPSKGGAVRDE